MKIQYIHLKPESSIPDMRSGGPYRAVLIIDAEISECWRNNISTWLVKTGCLYMMAWGHDAGSWDDSVDIANIEEWNQAEIPEDRFVYTTWHDDQTLDDVFWQSGHCANHKSVDISDTFLIHVSVKSDESAMLAKYAAAQLDD